MPKDSSVDRFKHLIGRIENSASQHYEDFRENDISFINEPIKSISNITHRILSSIDYGFIKTRRINNFCILHAKLASRNQLKFNYNEEMTPLVYPFLSDKPNLRHFLNKQKVYVAQYWPNVLKWTGEEYLEHHYAKNLVSLPIDQRYGKEEMDSIFKLIEKC